MDWKFELLLAFRAVIAAVLGGVIGWERERHGREAGIRTYAAVSLGACVFGLISSHASTSGDPGRIAAQVVTGVGFLGAGVIMRDQGRVHGLTTAATIWATASVGLSISYGMYTLGVLGAVIIFGLLAAPHLSAWSRLKDRHSNCSAQSNEDKNS